MIRSDDSYLHHLHQQAFDHYHNAESNPHMENKSVYALQSIAATNLILIELALRNSVVKIE